MIYRRPATGGLGRVVEPDAVAMMNGMMHDTFVIGTARKGDIPGWEAAGKTGTSQDFRDAWFVGYTGTLVAGVWLGNDDGEPTKRASGGNLPVEVWSTFMKTALKGAAAGAAAGRRLAESSVARRPGARGRRRADDDGGRLHHRPSRRAGTLGSTGRAGEKLPGAAAWAVSRLSKAESRLRLPSWRLTFQDGLEPASVTAAGPGY